MEPSYLIFLTLVAFGTCQVLPSTSWRSRPSLSSTGPDVTISLNWDQASCRRRLVSIYRVKLCSDSNRCTEKSVIGRITKFESSESFPLSFFNTYTFTVSYDCGWRAEWSRRQIDTGPGELRKLNAVSAIGGNQSATVSWRKPLFSTDYVEITVCHKSSGFCLETIRSSSLSEKYRVERLPAGVEYTAKLSVCKEFTGKIYRSQPVSVDFMTDTPEVREFPPVGDFAVQVVKGERSVDLELTYAKPKTPSGAEFRGVRIDAYDDFNSTVVDNLQSNDTKIAIRNLPYFAHFTIKARALYDDADDLVESVEVAQEVGTGTEVLPEGPQILEMMSISNHSALIRWSHKAHKSVEFSYNVAFGNEVIIEIQKSNANYTIIDKDLEPDRVYNVSFITLLTYGKQSKVLATEQRQFKMLPHDALMPKFWVDDIQGHFIKLRWNVTVPNGAPKCYVVVEHCQMLGSCIRTVIANVSRETREANLEIEPFERYNISMSTTCMLVPDIVTGGVSDTINVLAASRPPAVFRIDGSSPDENSLNVFWTPGPPYTKGYKVRYSAVSKNDTKYLDTAVPTCTISGLDSSTNYNVSVAPYSMNGTKILLGPYTSKGFRTLNHVPPEATELTVYQVPFTRTIKINWKVAPYDQGRLDFHVTTRCGAPYDFWTNETSVEFKSREGRQKSTLCSVAVQTFNLDYHQRAFSRTVHASTNLQTLPPPVGVDAVFVTDERYKIKVSPPQVDGFENFEYETFADGVIIDRYKTNEFVVSEKRFDRDIPYAVRVCVNDLCSSTFNFTITTNTGPPSRVLSVTLRIIEATTINVTWSRPMIPNGPIDGYFVDVTRRGDSDEVQTFQRSSGDKSLIFEAENEYTIYEVAVRAFNYDKLDRTVLKFGDDVIESIETEGTVPRSPKRVSSGVARGQKVIRWDGEADPKFNGAIYKIAATAVLTNNETILLRTTPVLELSALAPYTLYIMKISSCIDTQGRQCGESTTFVETTDVGHPNQPEVQLVDRNGTHILIRWSVPTKALGPINGYQFAFVKKTEGVSPTNWVSTGADERSAAVDKLEEGTPYVFHVRAYNIDCGQQKLYSPVGILETSTTVSTGDSSSVVFAASASMGTIGFAALVYVGYKKFGYSALQNH